MNYSAKGLCVVVIVGICAITSALAEGKKSSPNYWTSQVEMDCSNVPPLQHSNVEPRNVEYMRKQEQEVNAFFNRLIEEFKKKNFEYVADASTNFLQNWPGTVEQKKCVTSLQTQSLAAQKYQDDQQAKADHQPTLPAGRLQTLYLNYMVMQACFERRKAFRIQYVTQQEMEAVRTVAKRDELALLGANPALEKQRDQVWNLAKSQYGESVFARGIGASGTTFNKNIAKQCKISAMQYTGDKKYQQEQIRKDF